MKKMKSIKIVDNTESKENLKSINDINMQDKNSSTLNNENQLNDLKQSNTSQGFLKPKSKPNVFKEFQGFFFKKFNLTTYKKERDDSRERSKSPEYKYKPNHKKGNGVPDDLIKRLKYISKIINSENFQKYYNSKPKGKKVKFETISDYILNYSKSHNELESVLMVFYFICNDIKYYTKESLKELKESYKNKEEYSIFLDTQFFEDGYVPKPSEVYMKGIALHPNYFSNVFEYFLKKLEVKFKHIEGFCKLIEENENKKKNLLKKIKQKKISFYSLRSKSTTSLNSLQILPEYNINHIWNAVYMKGEWYFIDTFFGSGGFIRDIPIPQTKNTKKSKNNICTFYFMTPPEYLISTHRPVEDRWQFLEKTVTFQQFYNKKMINYGEFYKGVLFKGVELLSHKYPYIEIKKNEKLEIKLRLNEHILEGELYTPNLLNKVGEIRTIYEDETKIYIFEPIFPNIGEFILRVSSRPIITNDLAYIPLFDYKIKVKTPSTYLYFDKYKLIKKGENSKIKDKNVDSPSGFFLPKLNSTSNIRFQPRIINDYSKILPSKTNKIICYDNKNFHLIEPRTKILRKGIKFHFKIKIKGTNNVNLLDGNQWTPLKRIEEDVFECSKEIETDNVSICCLRNKNVFTEVIKFMIHKDRSILSKNIFPIVKKYKRNFGKLDNRKILNLTGKNELK